MSERLSVRTRFERFPATVKGAFILRGEDGDPHQIVFHEARAVSVGGEVRRPVPVATATLDIAPRRDVFVPFELVISDLESGWYGFECDLDVDGVAGTFAGDRRFAIAWPRASVRRGQIAVARSVGVGRSTVSLEHLDCGGDSLKGAFVVDPPVELGVRASVDGDRLDLLEVHVDETSGRGRFAAYPLLKVHRLLRLEFVGRGRGAAGALEIPLP